MFDWFKKRAKKEDVDRVERGVQTGFAQMKGDISNVSTWITHLKEKGEGRDDEISDIYEELSTIKSELENIKNMIDILGNRKLFKQRQTVFNKQTAVQSQIFDGFLDSLSITERAIVWVLLNSELKLSYDDLAAMLGKERATVRGQLNSIKQKSEGLIAEQIGQNNKKRFYVQDKLKGTMLRKVKVRLKRGRNKRKEKEE